jgi:hypothetical protein
MVTYSGSVVNRHLIDPGRKCERNAEIEECGAMRTESVVEVDAELLRARWGYWHAIWADDAEQLAAALAVIDDLLDRRFALTRRDLAAAA